MGKQNGKIQSSLSVAYFCKQLALLVKGGINNADAVSIIQENTRDKEQKALYAKIGESVRQGMPLAGALKETRQFPAYMTQIMQIGETSGKLDEVLEALYVYYERTDRINRGIKNIITYPVIMVCVMLAVIAVLLVKALPIFAQVFQQVGAEIPKYLQALSSAGATAKLSVIMAAVVVFLLIVFWALKYTAGGYALKTKFYENSFLTRNIAERANMNKFTFAMALLLSAGVTIDDAVNMVYDLADSAKMRDGIKRVKNMMAEDVALSAALTRTGMLSSEHGAMIAVGQKAGKLDDMMNTIAARLAEETDEWLERLISGFEPTIVIIMSLTVGGLLLSIMLPLMKIMSSM